MKKLTPTPIFPSIFYIGIALLTWNCGSYQGSSYYGSDGIYNSSYSQSEYRTAQPVSGAQNYYKNYFQNLSDDYTTDADQETVFTDVDAYTSVENNPNDQQPWGAQTQKTEIYLIDNTRNFNPNFGFDWYYNTWGYPYWGYYSPFGWWNRPYRFNNPYWGWSFYSPFYNPYFDNFYRPYWGWSYYGNGYYNSFYQPFNRFDGFQRRNVSRVRTNRGDRGYKALNRAERNALNRGEKKSVATVDASDINTTNVRYNSGRYINAPSIDNVPTRIVRSGSSQSSSNASQSSSRSRTGTLIRSTRSSYPAIKRPATRSNATRSIRSFSAPSSSSRSNAVGSGRSSSGGRSSSSSGRRNN